MKDGHSGVGFVAEPVELLEYHHLVDGHVRIVVKLVLGVVLEADRDPQRLGIDRKEEKLPVHECIIRLKLEKLVNSNIE